MASSSSSSSATAQVFIQTLTNRGWCFGNIDQIKALISIQLALHGDSCTVDSIESELCNLDLRSIGAKSLPDVSLLRKSSHFQGPKVLQVFDLTLYEGQIGLGGFGLGLEGHDDNIEVVKLITICWLEFFGKLEVSELSPEVDYEVAFVLKLNPKAFGWELPTKLVLTFPNAQVHERLVCLQEDPRGEWLEVSVGKFRRQKGEAGELYFNFSNRYGHWLGGMILKVAIIQPIKSIHR